MDDTLAARFLGKQRSGKHVGFNIDHDDMPTGGYRRTRMGDPGGRRASRLDDDLDLGVGA